MFQKIVVALDRSDTSQLVFDAAVTLAQATDATLMLLHVLSPSDTGYPDLPVYPGMDGIYPILHDEAVRSQIERWERYEEQGREFLRSLTTEAIRLGVKADFTQNPGAPGSTICTIAQNWQADLIMVGRRGRSGLSEFVMGSVSNYVTHHAPCSVLVVQGNGTATTTVNLDNHVVSIG